jgi:hypothetical protein
VRLVCAALASLAVEMLSNVNNRRKLYALLAFLLLVMGVFSMVSRPSAGLGTGLVSGRKLRIGVFMARAGGEPSRVAPLQRLLCPSHFQK